MRISERNNTLLALERCLDALEQSRKDPDGYARASAVGTLEVARASGNPKLLEMIESFAQQIGRYARIGLSTQGRRDRSLGNWRSLMTAIRSQDGDLAELMQRTLAAENRKAAVEMIGSRSGTQMRDSRIAVCATQAEPHPRTNRRQRHVDTRKAL